MPSAEVPFIDREASLAKLREVSRSADGPCLLLVGRQGIGKSRLLKRFAQVEATDPSAALICVHHESYRTSGSLQEFVRLELEIASHPAVQTALGSGEAAAWTPHLSRWLRESVGASDPTPGKALAYLPIEPLIREMLWSRTVIDEGEIVDNFLRSLYAISRTLREDQRLVLLLDPGVNLDEGSMDLRKLKVLYDVVRNLPARNVIILALRDSDPAAHDTDFLVLPNVEVYRDLEPFRMGDVHSLLKAVFGEDLQLEVAHHVHRKYGGDPFSTEMAILCAARSPQPQEALIETCPEKLWELMEAYHDGFAEPMQRRILRALSVPEEPATLDLLAALLDSKLDHEALSRILRAPEMARAAIPLPPTDDRKPRFRIYHEAFAEFLRERADQYQESEDLNRRAGAFYSGLGRSALALFHFGVAGDLQGISANIERGLEWHRIQGETRRLLRLYDILHSKPLSPKESFLLGKAVAWALALRGESDEVLARLEELIAATGEKSIERAELLLLRGDCYHNASRYSDSYSDFEAARSLLESSGETSSLLYRQVLLEAAHMLIHLGDFRGSEALHSRLIAAQRFPEGFSSSREVLVQASREIRRYGELLVFTGDWSEAERLLQLARREFAHLGHRRGEGDALRRISDLHLLRGGQDEYAKALQTARRAEELLTEVGSRGASFMGLVIGEAQRGLGHFDEALKAFEASLEEFADGESPHLLSMAEVGFAEYSRYVKGEPPWELYSRALSRYKAISSDWGIATTLFYRGLAYLTARSADSANSDFTQAREIFGRLGLEPPISAIARAIGEDDAGFFPLIVL
jgi:tetratricopeptide (TPR) repeat protein